MTGRGGAGKQQGNARGRVHGLSAASAVAASAALVLTACGGDQDKAAPTPSGTGQQAVNEGAGIPTKALTMVQSKAMLLTEQELPGGTTGYREQRVGAQQLNLGRSLESLSGLNSECATAVRAIGKQRPAVLSGAQASAKLPKEAAGGESSGTIKITVFTTRKGLKPADVLGRFSDTCSGTVKEPDSISPVQRGLKGVAVVKGKQRVTVAAGDWGANHVLVETQGLDAEVAQQVIDAQLAKLSAPTQ
jgi:hypothetical protein